MSFFSQGLAEENQNTLVQ